MKSLLTDEELAVQCVILYESRARIADQTARQHINTARRNFSHE
jgi:hypothetical protein